MSQDQIPLFRMIDEGSMISYSQLCFDAFALFKQFLMDAPLPSFVIEFPNGEFLTFRSRVLATMADLFGWTLLVDIYGRYDHSAIYRQNVIYGYPFNSPDATNEFVNKLIHHKNPQIVEDVQEACLFLSKVFYPLLGLAIEF